MKTKKINIPAIHDKDLYKVLTDYNLAKDFENNGLSCFNCGDTISENNLTGMIVENETLIFVCDNPDCLAHATSKNEEIDDLV